MCVYIYTRVYLGLVEHTIYGTCKRILPGLGSPTTTQRILACLIRTLQTFKKHPNKGFSNFLLPLRGEV